MSILTRPVHSRDALAAYALALHAAIQPYYSPGRARVRLGPFTGDFDAAAAELEGFARPLWGLAPLLKGGFEVPFWPEILTGLAAGTDPNHPEYWGDIVDYDQRIVESAAISFTLLLVPEYSWERLDQPARTSLVRWLNQIIAAKSPPNNWRFFQVLAHLALRSVGEVTSQGALDELLTFLDSCAIGPHGWSTDGLRPQADHYVGFAMQYYALLYAMFGDEPDRAERYRDQARRFGRQFREWFGEDGAALPFGRSLPYRFAHGAFWGAAAFAGAATFGPGAMRRLALGNIRWWQRTSMLDRDGVLSIGGAYPNPVVAEFYTSAQSPYWAFKAFLPLALPADHPFWTAPEEDPDTSELDRIQEIPGMILQRHAGVVTALAAGQEAADRFLHTAEKYGKFAYSTRYGFGVERDGRGFATGGFDNMLAVSRDGVHFAVRKDIAEHGILDGMQYSRWSPLPEVHIETVTVPSGLGHIRIHWLSTAVPIELAEGGFSLPMPPHGTVAMTCNDKDLLLDNGTDASGLLALESPAAPLLQRVVTAPGSHILFPRAAVPQWRLAVEAGSYMVATWFGASPDREGVAESLVQPPQLPDTSALLARLRQARPPEGWHRTSRVAAAFLAERDASVNGPRR